MRPVELENVAYIKRIKNFSCLDLCGLILFGEANIRDLINTELSDLEKWVVEVWPCALAKFLDFRYYSTFVCI